MKEAKSNSLFPESTVDGRSAVRVPPFAPTAQTPGQRLRQFRKELGLSQEAFAEQAGMDQSQISRYEAGIYRLSADHALQLARHFPIDWIWLLTGNPYPNKVPGSEDS